MIDTFKELRDALAAMPDGGSAINTTIRHWKIGDPMGIWRWRAYNSPSARLYRALVAADNLINSDTSTDISTEEI